MRSFAVLTAFFSATVLFAQDPTKELDKLNGAWVVTSAESGGVKLPNDTIKELKLTIKDGTFTAKLGGEEQRGVLKIDPAKKPMAMDITLESGADKGKTQLAIYELQTGVLKICVADFETKERPKDFDTKMKPGMTFLLLQKGQ